MFAKYCGFEKVIDGHRYAIGTRRVVIERDLCGRVAVLAEELLPPSGTLLLVCDRTTWEIAGEAVAKGYLDAGRDVDKLLVIEPQDHAAVADEANIAHVREVLEQGAYVGAIAVGSGTVNDIAKMASDRAGVDYIVVGTAPSMNGYTSAIAAILSDGLKTTQPCHMPVGVFCDVDVMASAPYRMIASGLGDLLSRPVSNADWRLGARMVDAFYTSFPLELIAASRDALEGVPARLPSRDPWAVGKLAESLCLSGMAMAAVGTSSPASGGEHLISHYIDMVAIAQGEEHDFHGCQVGVGTLTTAAMYERLKALDPTAIDVNRLVARHLPWEAYRRTLEQRFGELGLMSAVEPQARKAYPDRPTLRARLATLVEDWDEIIADVTATMEVADAIRVLLVAAEAPHTFADLGVSPAAARRAVLYSKDIRARYTILDLAAELGVLEEWVDDLLDPAHGLVHAPS